MKSFLKSVVVYICCLCNLAAAFAFYPKAPETPSVQFAQSLGHGWNLGNTLEAWSRPKPADTETCWGNPKTTKALISLVKELGFTSVRIPVTWFQHMDEEGNIEQAWLNRVNEVVDYVLQNGMYAIVNVQHDDQDWLITDYAHKASAGRILTKIWTQLSAQFADYNQSLVFDLMNEPRVVGSPNEWTGTVEERDVVNYLNEKALAAIRNSGGNNATRYVMITTCCASVLPENCDALVLPDDDHVIVSLHYYYQTAHRSEFEDCKNRLRVSDYLKLHKTLRRIFKTYLKKGVGVCIGEFGWTDRVHLDHLTARARAFVRLVGNYSMSCLVWDNGADFRLIDRQNLTAEYPDYIESVTRDYRKLPKVEGVLSCMS